MGKPELAPSRVATLRDKLSELEKLRRGSGGGAAFDKALASLTPDEFVDRIPVQGPEGSMYVLVGDDFRFGAKRRATTPCSMPWAARVSTWRA